MKVGNSPFRCRSWLGLALVMAVAYLAQMAPHGHDTSGHHAAHQALAAPAAQANHAHHNDGEHAGTHADHDSPPPAPHHHSAPRHLDIHSLTACPRAGLDDAVVLVVPAAVAVAADACPVRRVAPPAPEPAPPDDPLLAHAPLRAPPAWIRL